jgi:hypothetical protein
MRPSFSVPLLVLVLFQPACFAQVPPLDLARQQAVVEKTIQHVRASYVFPDKAQAVEAALRANLRDGRYAALTKVDDFLDALNRDMQVAASDKHLRVVSNPRIVAQLRKEAAGEPEDDPEFLRMLRGSNFRLVKAETLDGNVGYFKFDNFVEMRFVHDAFVGAMNFLHDTSALVLDLTDNGGGAAETADFLLSYLLPAGTRTGESWDRTTNETTISTVAPAPEVKQRLDVPLYVLVGERTASAAEGVAYTLQQAKRAVVVGSRTKGMANPGRQFVIDDRFFVIVPTILQRNSVSGTNWEGVGVVPDLEAAPEHALDAAMASALGTLADGTADEKEKHRLRFLAEDFGSRISPQAPPSGFLDACLGSYEDGQQIVAMDGRLWYVKGKIHRKLRYMEDFTFAVDGRMDYRLRLPFERGKVARCEVLWFDDTSDTYRRTD